MTCLRGCVTKNEWILGNLLERIYLHSEAESIFSKETSQPELVQRIEVGALPEPEQGDGLIVSATPVKVIELPEAPRPPVDPRSRDSELSSPKELDWLSQPLSGRSLAWTVNTLVVLAAGLLFALIFLVVIRKAPRWPFAMAAGDAVVIGALYWGFSEFCGGASVGERLARLLGSDQEEQADGTRFR